MRRLVSWLSPCSVLAGAVFCFLLATAPVSAQEVKWRTDYNSARKEAEKLGKPLVIDFGTQNCFWCKKLEMNTFSDAGIAGIMNEKFIPLKIDAEREATLAQSLNIHSYPTIVLASADGKILGTVVGYKEVPEFNDILQRALAGIANPEWMVRDYAEASKAVAASEYARAMALLKPIVEDGKDRPVQVKARQMLQEVEQQAAAKAARDKRVEEKPQTTESTKASTDSRGSSSGTNAAVAVKPPVNQPQRTKRARELLAQVREDYRTQQYLCCLDRCELLAANYADLPEGNEAVQLAGEIKNNPEWMKSACDSLTDRLGMLYLAMAETWLNKGQPQQAVQCLEKVVQTFPGTRQAEVAQVRLSFIKGQPNVQAEFKSPDPASTRQ